MYPFSKKWWHFCTTIRRFMPGEDGFSVEDIIKQLPSIKSSGYKAIHITAPYKSAGFTPWWGLRPLDYFQINSVLGNSIVEFSELVKECHRWDLKIIIFINLGYGDVFSEIWKKACIDKKLGISSPESNYFLWSDDGQDSLEKMPTSHFRQEGYWHWNEEAQSHYWCFWCAPNPQNPQHYIAEPQYNWANPDFQNYVKQILCYWLDTGIDGVIIDAVNKYTNCDWNIIKTCVTDIAHSYPEVLCIPEGATGFGDYFLPWITEGNFDIIEDQTFESDWDNDSLLNKIHSSNPSFLEKKLFQNKQLRLLGKPTWSYISYMENLEPCKRLLEIAMLIGTGHITEIIPSYLSNFQKDDFQKLKELLQLSNHPSLTPIETRIFISTNQNHLCYSCLCSQKHSPVLCIFNFQPYKLDIIIDLEINKLPKVKSLQNLVTLETIFVEESLLKLSLSAYSFSLLELKIF